MWSELGARRAARVVLALALAAAFTAPAAAGPKLKKPPRAASAFGLSAPFDLLPSLPARVAAPTPLRFFSINQVLAKHDRMARDGGAVRLASVQGTLSDAPASEPPPRGDEPFGLFAFRAPEACCGTSGVASARHANEAFTIERCRAGRRSAVAAALRLRCRDGARSAGTARLEAVSHAVNKAIRSPATWRNMALSICGRRRSPP